MWSLTEELATSIYDAANIALIIALASTVIATMLVVWTGNVKEGYLKREVADAHERAANALASAATANEHAAETERQNIEIRKTIANRRITPEQHAVLVAELSKQPSHFIIESMSDPESALFAADILKTFTDARWKADSTNFPMGVIWHGLILFQSGDLALSFIISALQKAEIPFSFASETRSKATLLVGGKPPVF